MGVFPKLVLLKGAISSDPKFRQLLKRHGNLSALDLCHFLMDCGIVEIANKRVICFGEGDCEKFELIVMNDLDTYTSVTVYNDDSVSADAIINFFSNVVLPKI